jgi:hypothetical protein
MNIKSFINFKISDKLEILKTLTISNFFPGYKSLPQYSVLSRVLYNLLGSGMDRFLPSGCDFFQYADDIVVYFRLLVPSFRRAARA